MTEIQPKVQPAMDPLNKGRGTPEEGGRSANDLIQTEWKIIDDLLAMVESTKDDGKKAFFYQTMMGHVRTLSMLLQVHGQPDKNQDLAKILSQIKKEAKIVAKRLKQR